MELLPLSQTIDEKEFRWVPIKHEGMLTPFQGVQPVPYDMPYLYGVHIRTALDDIRTIRDTVGEASGHVLEVGSALGGTTLAMASAVDELASVYAVDPWSMAAYSFEEFASNVYRAGYQRKIVPIRAKSDEALPQLIQLGMQFSVVFIDGLHSGPLTIREIEASHKLLEENGILFVHDMYATAERMADMVTDYMAKNLTKWQVLSNPWPLNRYSKFDEVSSLLVARRI